MDLIEQLKHEGWIFSPEGYETLTEDGQLTDKNKIIQKALNCDLIDFGGCGFPTEISKTKNERIAGNIVVQIKKVRNLSAPKSNAESQTAPRMLKLTLTDGTQTCIALEMNHIPTVCLDTIPGTKLKLKGEITIKCGLLLLYSSNIQLLGGLVEKLFDKWNICQDAVKQTRRRVGVVDGPPPWIPFGERMATNNISDKIEVVHNEDRKASKDNECFEAQRRVAIAEAGVTGSKKIFGGGSKLIIDKNVQCLLEKGFSVREAEIALRQTNNNLDKALRNLQRRTPGRGGEFKEKVEKEGGRGGRRKAGENEVSQKPTSTIFLYQFLKDSFPSTEKEKDKPKEKESKEWEQSKPPHTDSFNSHRQRNYSYDRGRGGHRGGSYNSGGHERRPRDDTRNPRWQGSNQNQKPPRFQNQHRNKTDSSDNFDQFMRRNDSATSTNTRNSDSYFSHKSNNSPNNHHHPQQYNGYRNYYKLDNINYNQSSGEYRNQNSSYLKPAGMPDIPEFPYKDNSFMSMVPQSNNTGNNRSNSTSVNKPDKYRWKMGDKCLAKYWEDNEYYNAEVTAISDKTCVVRFLDYGNFEEVLKDDCLPVSDMPSSTNPDNRNSSYNNGVIEFRRGGRGSSYVKSDGMGPRKNQRYSQPVYMPPPGRSPK